MRDLTEMSLDELRRARQMVPSVDDPEYERLGHEIQRRLAEGEDEAHTRRQEIQDEYADEIEAARRALAKIEADEPEHGCTLEEYRAWQDRKGRAREKLERIAAEIGRRWQEEGVAPERGQDERSQPNSYI